MKSKLLYILISLFIPAVVIAADNEAVEVWLQKMHRAAHTLNYSGKFVYQQGKQLNLMKIIHASDNESENERLISLDDIGREIIRSNGIVTCILPDSKSVVVKKAGPKQKFPPEFPVKIDHLKNLYRFMLSKKEHVAGRLSQKIVIAPEDQYRYGHRLWIDNETGLLLKTHLVDEKGRLLEQFMFTEITFLDTIPVEWLQHRAVDESYTWYESEAPKRIELSNKIKWVVKKLPVGFNSDMNLRHNKADKKGVRHLVFTDGLASVSIFIERSQKRSPNLEGLSRMGAVNAFGRVYNDHYVTAVGEVPSATVKLISESVILEAP